MQDPRLLGLIAKHLSGNETLHQRDELSAWLNESAHNRELFEQIKKTWQNGEGEKITFRKRFTRKRLTEGLIEETLSNLVGFMIGLWISHTFTHYVRERKSIYNLFGIMGRKKKVVHDIPEWMQYTLSILLGFLAMELIHHFFQSKKHIAILSYLKKAYKTLKQKLETIKT